VSIPFLREVEEVGAEVAAEVEEVEVEEVEADGAEGSEILGSRGAGEVSAIWDFFLPEVPEVPEVLAFPWDIVVKIGR
jgi:hypothetical protein